MGKQIILVIVMIVAMCAVLSSCAPRETVREIETIAIPVGGFGYNIQLRIDSIIYSPFGLIDTVIPSEIYIPLGEKLGVAQNFTFISVFEVYGYSPNEWLYGVYDNEGGITLFKADNVTDIPAYFYELLEAEQRLLD